MDRMLSGKEEELEDKLDCALYCCLDEIAYCCGLGGLV